MEHERDFIILLTLLLNEVLAIVSAIVGRVGIQTHNMVCIWLFIYGMVFFIVSTMILIVRVCYKNVPSNKLTVAEIYIIYGHMIFTFLWWCIGCILCVIDGLANEFTPQYYVMMGMLVYKMIEFVLISTYTNLYPIPDMVYHPTRSVYEKV